MNTELTKLSGTAQGVLLQRGEVSSVDLVRAHLEVVEAVNPTLNAVVDLLGETALDEAKAADRRHESGVRLGPLDGVPFSVKDSLEVKGRLCSAGTLGSRNWAASERDAAVVARLRAGGAIPVARTNLPDLLFAFETDNLLFGRTNNPYSLDRTPGGSSGGEAALIAACGSPFGLGSDCAGSVRVPAHYCGIASLKPTSGRLARTGHVPPAGGWIEALWQIGPMARWVEDLVTVFPMLIGVDGVDPTVIPMPHGAPEDIELMGLKIGVFTDNGIASADADTQATVRLAALSLAALGAHVEEIRPPGLEAVFDLEMQMIGPEGGDGLREYANQIGSLQTHGLFNAWLAKLKAYRTDVAGFAKFWSELDRYRQTMRNELGRFDAFVSPVSSSPAIEHGRSVDEEVFRGFSYTMTYNLTGWPAGVTRCGTSVEGLPIGVQIAAAPWREDVVLSVALALEQACGGWQAPAMIRDGITAAR